MKNLSVLVIVLLLFPVKIALCTDVEDKLVGLVSYCLENPKILTSNAFFGLNFADALVSGNSSTPKKIMLKQQFQILRTLFRDFVKNNHIYAFDFVINPKFWRENLNFSKEKLNSGLLNISLATYEVLSDVGSPNEKESDECLRELSGKFCHVSRRCWKIMSLRGMAFGYHQTHKLLFYMVLSRKANCNFPHEISYKIIRKLCKRILSEVLTIAQQGFPDYLQDLVMEQIFLCSFSGFLDFLKPDWIRDITTWQDKSGCFHFKPVENQSYCSDHMTGVGAALLALILRYSEEENA